MSLEQKTALRKRMRELDDELNGLRRVVLGKTYVRPRRGSIHQGEVTSLHAAGAFVHIPEHGSAFLSAREISRRVLLLDGLEQHDAFADLHDAVPAAQRRALLLPAAGVPLPPAVGAAPVQLACVPLPDLISSVLHVGDSVWAEIIDVGPNTSTGQMYLSLRDVCQRSGTRLLAEPDLPAAGSIVKGVVSSVREYGCCIELPGFREEDGARRARSGLLHRSHRSFRLGPHGANELQGAESWGSIP